MSIVQKTPESEAKLSALVKLVAPFIITEEQAAKLVVTLLDFVEQVVLDDRARIKADLIGMQNDVEFIEENVYDLIKKLGL